MPNEKMGFFADASKPEKAAKKTANKVFNEAFDKPRCARSFAYKMGVKAVLLYKFNKVAIYCPFDAGVAECDAFYAGCSEGRRLYADYLADAFLVAPS